MDTLSPLPMQRRLFLSRSTAMLSAGGLLALAGAATPAFAEKKAMTPNAQDAELLNAAIGLEHEGIAAYQISAESGLLSKDVLALGISFQGHHKRHLDELAKAVRRLGGKPAEAKKQSEYATELEAGKLKSEADILKLALRLERGATNAYLGMIPSLRASEFDVLVARLAADEAVHVALLMPAVGEKLSADGFFFG